MKRLPPQKRTKASRTVSLEDVRTKGLFKQMLKLGWPMSAAAILDTSYQLADTFWLGRLPGDIAGDAVAGLQIIFPFVWFAAAIIIGYSLAGMSMVSQFTGAGRKEKADLAAGQVISLAIISGILIAVAGQIIVPLLMPFVTDIASLIAATNAYLKIYFLGLPFLFVTGVCRSLLSAGGNSRTPLKIVLVGNIANIILNSLLVFGAGPLPALGIHGAAIATVISLGITAGLSMALVMMKNYEIHVSWASLIPRFNWCKRIITIALPAAVGNSAESFGFILLLLMIGQVEGARDALGGFGMGLRIINIAMFIMVGLSMGLTVITGQFLGAGDTRGAENTLKKGFLWLTTLLTLEMGIIILFRTPLLVLFIPKEPGMVMEGSRYLLIVGLSIPCYGIVQGVMSAFNAAGNNTPTLLISVSRLWIFRLPICYCLSVFFGLGAPGIWYGILISNFLSIGIAVPLFMKGGWKKGVENITQD
jgi:putative MATE family efflux protein